MTESDYKAGEKAFYHETGDIFQVEILKNFSDKEWMRYRLRILSVEQTTFQKPPKTGTEFTCEKRQGVACGGLWYILDN